MQSGAGLRLEKGRARGLPKAPRRRPSPWRGREGACVPRGKEHPETLLNPAFNFKSFPCLLPSATLCSLAFLLGRFSASTPLHFFYSLRAVRCPPPVPRVCFGAGELGAQPKGPHGTVWTPARAGGEVGAEPSADPWTGQAHPRPLRFRRTQPGGELAQ